ncbi:MAG: type II toxin-antitoxin system RelE/ParE family toxin [bacterium]|nr:type II toxin-antitoxin system RelE/ParE family toxin [bacterium]
MNFAFHPEAEDEFLDAIAYYQNCDDGLGLDFVEEVFAAIKNAVDYPFMWPEIDHEIRRCLVHRFPYGVLYSIETAGIFVLAVMNLHRNPDYWKHRQ